MKWTRHEHGRGWLYDEQGDIHIERKVGIPRTNGAPKTMRLMLEDFGDEMREASDLLGVSMPVIMAIIALESVPIKGSLHRNPMSYRWEARINDYSAGLMQTLSNTAVQMADKYELPVQKISKRTLYNPRTSILCGVAYIKHLSEKNKTEDGMLLQAAYNAGGIYTTSKNEWHLRTFSPDRTERFAQWHNDALAVLREVCS